MQTKKKQATEAQSSNSEDVLVFVNVPTPHGWRFGEVIGDMPGARIVTVMYGYDDQLTNVERKALTKREPTPGEIDPVAIKKRLDKYIEMVKNHPTEENLELVANEFRRQARWAPRLKAAALVEVTCT